MSTHRMCPRGTSLAPARFRLLGLTLSLCLAGLAVPSHAQGVARSTTTDYVPPSWTAPQPLDSGKDIQPDDLPAALAQWRQANAEVADFPRGHIDLMRWEKQHAPRTAIPGGGRPDATPDTPLGLAEVLTQSLSLRPDLLDRPGTSPQHAAEQRVALADLRRDIQNTWVEAVAARQAARLQFATLQNTRAGTALGRRMVRAGNWSQARYLQEQRLEADAWQSLVQARMAEISATEALARLMGLTAPADVQRMSDRLPAEVPAPDAAELTALPKALGATQLDAVAGASPALAAARQKATRHLEALPAGRWQAWQEAVSRAMQQHSSEGANTLPRLLEERMWRDGALQEAVEVEGERRAMETERQSDVRQAWAALQWRSAQLAHLEQTVVPLTQATEQETVLRYNGMLQSTWELLASARDRLQAMEAAVRARSAYWNAQANWDAMTGGANSKLAAADMPAASGQSSNGAGH